MTIEEHLVKAMDDVFNSRGQIPEMIYVPGFGPARVDTDEAKAYMRELLNQPRVYTRVMDDDIKTKDGAA